MKKKRRRHLIIAGIICLIIILFVVATTGIKNIIWGFLLGLIYVGYYVLNVKGYNPIINSLKTYGQGDYGIKNEEVSSHSKNEKELK